MTANKKGWLAVGKRNSHLVGRKRVYSRRRKRGRRRTGNGSRQVGFLFYHSHVKLCGCSYGVLSVFFLPQSTSFVWVFCHSHYPSLPWRLLYTVLHKVYYLRPLVQGSRTSSHHHVYEVREHCHVAPLAPRTERSTVSDDKSYFYN